MVCTRLPFGAVRAVAVVFSALLACTGPAHALPERPSADDREALARLAAGADSELVYQRRASAQSTMLRTVTGGLLWRDGGVLPPIERAHYFLSIYGAALGVQDPAAQLRPQRVSTDAAGHRHVHLEQVHEGLPVFGARLVVHMNEAGIYGVNGVVLRNVAGLSTSPTRSAADVRASALAYAAKHHPSRTLTVASGRWLVYPVGLVQGRAQTPRLAYEAFVTGGSDVRERIFVDAHTGAPLDRFSEVHAVLNREVYSPDQTAAPVLIESSPLAPNDPLLIDDPGYNGTVASGDAPGVPEDNLFVFAGGTYALYANMFGRRGYDACDEAGPCQPDQPGPAWSPIRGDDYVGQIQKSVYLINQNCPNAYWNGDSTNYCPGFDADDIVSHEWSHAYTQYTADLIYAYQSGALNESYSDIFGETYDLVNKLEGPLGSLTLDEHKYYEEGGSRWVVGEDLSEEAAALLLRDMWKPDDFPAATPGSTTSGNYACGSGDGGGVHTNSGVPNHTFAMLVDGTAGQGPEGSDPKVRNSFNGRSFAGLGLVKAAHIYFQAHSHYETPSSDFHDHAAALEASCQDLKNAGLNLKGPTGAPSGQTITQADCDIVHEAVLATELYREVPCPFMPVLSPGAPAACAGAATIFNEDWETGDDGWTRASTGVFAEWNDASRNLRDFRITSTLPAGHTGNVAFAPNVQLGEPGGGDCQPGSEDYSGEFSITSPAVTIPAAATDLELRFHHYAATEGGFDGGQLEVSVNAGSFAPVAQERYVFNAPNAPFQGVDYPNTNPNAGENAWTGVDVNPPHGAPLTNWGTTIVDLNGLAAPGDTVQLRFKFSQDGCNGRDGWYVDDVRVYSCPVLAAPTATLGDDYENPDSDGAYTLNWTRPEGASGPDLVQSSVTSCAALVADDAENGLGKWVATTEGDGARAWAPSTTKRRSGTNSFWATYTNGSDAAALGNVPASLLALKDAVTIPVDGATDLKFWDLFVHEGDDGVFVDISTDGGATWTMIHQAFRVMGPEEAGPVLAAEPLAERTVSLAQYKGQSIKVRFRFQSGGEDRPASAPFGWYVDDIAIVNDNWGDLLTTTATSHALTAQPNGARCYRVRTQYNLGSGLAPGAFSDVVTATVNVTGGGGGNGGGGGDAPLAPADGTVGNNQLGGAMSWLAMLGFGLLGGLRRSTRRRTASRR